MGVPHQSELLEQVESAVNGGDVHRRCGALHPLAGLLGCRVLQFPYRVQHELALRRQPHAALVQCRAESHWIPHVGCIHRSMVRPLGRLRSMRMLVMLDGTVADPDSAVLRVDDLGLMRGDGIFETVLVTDRHARELGPHLDRLARSAALLDLPEPERAAWEHCVQLVLDSWPGGQEFALKLVYTRGVEGVDGAPTGFTIGFEIAESVLRQRNTGVAAVTLERGFGPDVAARAPWLLLGAKSLSYATNMAALREAARRGADEVVFTATDGSVLEGPTSTVIVVSDRSLRTPPAHIGILPGTTQAALFRAAERAGWSVKVEPVLAAELPAADGVFLASSVRKITRVHTLDGLPLPDSTELHRELSALYESEY